MVNLGYRLGSGAGKEMRRKFQREKARTHTENETHTEACRLCSAGKYVGRPNEQAESTCRTTNETVNGTVNDSAGCYGSCTDRQAGSARKQFTAVNCSLLSKLFQILGHGFLGEAPRREAHSEAHSESVARFFQAFSRNSPHTVRTRKSASPPSTEILHRGSSVADAALEICHTKCGRITVYTMMYKVNASISLSSQSYDRLSFDGRLFR